LFNEQIMAGILDCCHFKGQLKREMNLWSNNTSVHTVVNRFLRFVFMINEYKEFHLLKTVLNC